MNVHQKIWLALCFCFVLPLAAYFWWFNFLDKDVIGVVLLLLVALLVMASDTF